jgi:hypothetical protein
MTNHIHLLVQLGDRPLGELMQRVASRFARMIQRRVPTTGHLFENRYHALLVDADRYLLELLRYIHLNPVRGGLVQVPEQYRWSSHRVYLGLREQAWLTTDFALSLFGPDVAHSRAKFAEFVAARLAAPKDPTLFQSHARDNRVLGDDRFLATLNAKMHKTRPRTTLQKLIASICAETGVSPDELATASQAPRVARTRGMIAAAAVEEQVATLSEIARQLGRSISAISRAAAQYRAETSATSLQVCKPDTS